VDWARDQAASNTAYAPRRDRIYVTFAFAASALAAFGFVKALGAVVPVGTRDEWSEMGATVIFVCALILMVNGVEHLGDARSRKNRAEKAGFSDPKNFEDFERQRGEMAILRRAPRVYGGHPDGTSFEEACRIKAAQNDEQAKIYLRWIAEHRTLEGMAKS
jgi:hypothetical protein